MPVQLLLQVTAAVTTGSEVVKTLREPDRGARCRTDCSSVLTSVFVFLQIPLRCSRSLGLILLVGCRVARFRPGLLKLASVALERPMGAAPSALTSHLSPLTCSPSSWFGLTPCLTSKAERKGLFKYLVLV